MSILQYKYKAHRLVNTLFYVIVFVIGFLLGFGAKKIDFNNLLSQVLMIDNVSAYTIYDKDDIKIDERKIYDLFSLNENFDIEIYSNIICSISYTTSSIPEESGDYLYCFAYKPNDINYFTYSTTSSLGYVYKIKAETEFSFYRFSYFLKDDTYPNNVEMLTYGTNATATHIFYTENGPYSNFNLPGLSESSNANINKLDFEGVNLQFNENLFKDNPDFKEVCVDSSRYFAISSDSFVNESSIFSDFLWFPYGLYGLYEASYSKSENKIIYFDNASATSHYYFTCKEVIDESFDENSGLKYLLFDNSYYSYDNRYLYYGWSAFPFDVSYSNVHTSIPVFYFENPVTYSSIGNNIHGGSGTRLEFDDGLEEPLEYCFYIKNNYHVVYLEVDEFGDYYGDIITPNGNLHISSNNNKDDISSGGLMSQVNEFINEIKDTINFIKDNVYDFYLSMPLLFRMFLVSIFVILIVNLIIGMVVK